MEFSCLPGVVELETEEGSKSPARFRKELLRAGTYTHPHDPHLTLTVTPQRLEKWVAAFKAAPFKVYVPLRHTKDPAQNAGWVEEIFMEEESLYGILCITDEEIAQKIREGSIQDVSLAVEKDVTDANGHTYEELITHVALTLDPHFRQQEPFLELEGENQTVAAHAETDAAVEPLEPNKFSEVEEEIKGYLAAGKITPASVPYLRTLLAAEGPAIRLESEKGGEITQPLQLGDNIRAFLDTLPSVIDYRELGQVEISGPPGRLTVERAEKEARRILQSQ